MGSQPGSRDNSSTARPRIVLPLLARASFIDTDIRLLSEEYDVQVQECRSLRGLLRTCMATLSADCVYCWFASFWFVPVICLARVRRIPVVIVCGGYDVANLPEIGYGNLRSPLARLLGRSVFRAASVILPFSSSAAEETRANAAVAGDRLRMIYLAVPAMDGDDMTLTAPRQPVVLTVSNIDRSTLTRKGLLTVAAVSRLMPDTQFIIVGAGEPAAVLQLQGAAGPNVRIMGRVDDATLRNLMRTSKVVFQPSRHEGFGMAVAEAMLLGAVPVVSRRFSLPEVVGDSGLFGDPDDPPSFVAGLRQALAAPPGASTAARQHILSRFSLQQRRSALFAVMHSVCPVRDPVG